MGGKRARSTERGCGGSYSASDLEKAVQERKLQGISYGNLSKKYGIPRSTIKLHVDGWKGKRPRPVTMIMPDGCGGGRTTDIQADDERKLAKLIECMMQWGFGLSRKEIIGVVEEFVKANNLHVRFTNGKPGWDWWRGFKARHNLVLKKPQAIECSRVKQQKNPFIIYGYFGLLEDTMKRLGLEKKPDHIYNLDESAFSSDPVVTKVCGRRGDYAKRQISGSGRENTTVLACVSAAGDKMPPVILHAGTNVWSSWYGADAYKDTVYMATDKGWMDRDSFYSWFSTHFIQKVAERPLLLIYDGHVSHISVQVIQLAIENNITIVVLPAHTTHVLQPLDKSCFRSLKLTYDELLTEWQRKHYGMKLSKAEFSNILGKSWHHLTPQVIRSGFKSCGIFPLDRTVIPKKYFDPQLLKQYESKAELGLQNLQEVHANVITDNACASTSTDIANDNNEAENTSTNRPEHMDVSITSEINNNDANDRSKENCSAASTSANSSLNVSFEELILKKIETQRNEKSRRKKMGGRATCITEEDFLKAYQAEEEIRKKKKEDAEKRKRKIKEKQEIAQQKAVKKKKKEKTKALSDDEETSDSISLSLHDTEDDEECFFSEDENVQLSLRSEPTTERQIGKAWHSIQSGEFILESYYAVYYDEKFFIGRIISTETNGLKMKFLEENIEKKFQWPKREDIQVVEKKFVFYGPIELQGSGPFAVHNIPEIQSMYRGLKRNKFFKV